MAIPYTTNLYPHYVPADFMPFMMETLQALNSLWPPYLR